MLDFAALLPPLSRVPWMLWYCQPSLLGICGGLLPVSARTWPSVELTFEQSMPAFKRLFFCNTRRLVLRSLTEAARGLPAGQKQHPQLTEPAAAPFLPSYRPSMPWLMYKIQSVHPKMAGSEMPTRDRSRPVDEAGLASCELPGKAAPFLEG